MRFAAIAGLVASLIEPRVAASALGQDAAEPKVAAADCPTIAGVATALEPGRILLLGEIHGTVESPAFLAALLCHVAAADRSVAVALELPESAGQVVGEYLASAGATRDREALVMGFSSAASSYPDGRFSDAIVDLIEAVRRLRARGSRLEVILFVPTESASEQRRERLMAERISRAAQTAGSDLFVVFTGLLHSRVIRGTRWNPDHEPLGYLLAQWHPRWNLLSLALSHSGGTAWICSSTHPTDCRPLALTGAGNGTVNSINLLGEVAATGHHGVYFVGELSYSPPADPIVSEPMFSREEVVEMPFERPPSN